jgi:hypothetical protein
MQALRNKGKVLICGGLIIRWRDAYLKKMFRGFNETMKHFADKHCG